MTLKILFEDNHIIVVQKPPGILSQADAEGVPDLVNELKNYVKRKYNKPGNVYVGLVHRLDRNVGGVMVFARTSKAASRLSKQVRDHQFKKSYLAVVEGKFEMESDTLVDYLVKDTRTNMTKVSNKTNKFAKEAILDYKVIRFDKKVDYSLVEVKIKTGRSHQIRVQLSHLGHPIVGDFKYGFHDRTISKKEGALENSLALWAFRLEFIHPTLNTKLSYTDYPTDSYPWSVFSQRA